jgi:hypothetical protein
MYMQKVKVIERNGKKCANFIRFCETNNNNNNLKKRKRVLSNSQTTKTKIECERTSISDTAKWFLFAKRQVILMTPSVFCHCFLTSFQLFAVD